MAESHTARWAKFYPGKSPQTVLKQALAAQKKGRKNVTIGPQESQTTTQAIFDARSEISARGFSK